MPVASPGGIMPFKDGNLIDFSGVACRLLELCRLLTLIYEDSVHGMLFASYLSTAVSPADFGFALEKMYKSIDCRCFIQSMGNWTSQLTRSFAYVQI